MEPLLEIDGDVRSFEVFLSSRMPVLTARDVEMFLPCTVNLDPKLREIIAGSYMLRTLYRWMNKAKENPTQKALVRCWASVSYQHSLSEPCSKCDKTLALLREINILPKDMTSFGVLIMVQQSTVSMTSDGLRSGDCIDRSSALSMAYC